MTVYGFPADEFQGRITRLQSAMTERDLSALLLTSAADFFYVTGFLTRFWESPARPWFLVVPCDRPPVAVIPSIGEPLMARTGLADIRTWEAPDPRDDGIGLLAATLAECTAPSARIGVPGGLETHLRMPLFDYERLCAGLAPRTFADATDCVQRVREIKSEREIKRIRAACAVADRAFARIPEIARPGDPLGEVFRAFQVCLLQEGADWVAYLAGGAGPDGYTDVISPAGPRPLQAGDVLMLDTGVVRDGYFCDFDRNFAIGTGSARARRVHTALWQATETVLERLRPGWLARDVHATFCESLRSQGLEPGGGRFGHGLGITLTEWPSFTPLDQTPLRAGMVLTLEPNAATRGEHILVHEENLVLRDNGPELLSSRGPAELPEL